MLKVIRKYMESNRKIRTFEICLLCLLLAGSIASFLTASWKVNAGYGELTFVRSLELQRQIDDEDYDEDSTICDVTYSDGDAYLVKSYSYEEYENLQTTDITAYEYITDNGYSLYFDHADPAESEISFTYQYMTANAFMTIYNLASCLIILCLSLGIVTFLSGMFTTYEKCWFMSIMILASIVAVIFPEESANGINGVVIMLLYLLDTFLNILCELLISKQSRYNFLVSVAVEIVEIAMCIVLMYRFSTMVTTLFFWLPIDILSYINWSRHKDDEADELTAVRRLKGWQEVLVLAGIVIWTVVIGYFISGLNIQTDFFNGDQHLETMIIYIDACASAVGVANGLFIFFRLREQWIAWYICALLESIINILTGQYVLLVLKLGYFTNTTYGYIRWSRYIKTHKEEQLSVF